MKRCRRQRETTRRRNGKRGEVEKLSDAENKEVSKNETESTKEKLEKVITHGAVELLIESIEKRVRRDLPEKEVRQ